jgi:hypothetical protein
MKYVIISLIVLFFITGCAEVDTSPKIEAPAGAVFCTAEQKAAEMCTMEYMPVCGYDAEGNVVGTGGNKCSACAMPEVVYYIEGECLGESFLPDIQCEELYWVDEEIKECTLGEFCGAFMYYGLQTFESQEECFAAVRVPCTAEQIAQQGELIACTKEYMPACGYDVEGNIVGTGGNGCEVCNIEGVVEYSFGECQT